MIHRYSSRKERLNESLLNKRLENAVSYDRIAGYFSSSIIEIAGEAIEKMNGSVRVVCNSQLRVDDVKTLSAANQSMRTEWCSNKPEEKLNDFPDRLQKLYKFLKEGKIKVKVIPNECFGLIHGKAGVITSVDGKKTSFLGSMNETLSGWKHNYEIVWEDNSPEAVDWVQQEFDFLWNHPAAKPLSDFVIQDIKRISIRKVIYDIEDWKSKSDPASTVIESPVYRQEYGLWNHQKYFVKIAYDAHKSGPGSRFILADMVGLGKTIQLALVAQLIALDGNNKPILIIAPKNLLTQWQDEMKYLLNLPSAIWDKGQWTDENGIKYPSQDNSFVLKCPRKIGIISQGLITAKSDVIDHLLKKTYDCIIIDEAHKARRKNLSKDRQNERPQPNNLMDFLLKISPKTKNMFLATATPVQLYPIEAWDLLYILSKGNDYVLGTELSNWRTNPVRGLNLITNNEKIDSEYELWDWLRNPFPPSTENDQTFGLFRRQLNMKKDEFYLKGDLYEKLNPQQKMLVKRIFNDHFINNNNPYIRHIVRRTREFLENKINPETNEPYLKPIAVRLFGENEEEAIKLPPYLKDAYNEAENFSKLIKKRINASGFIKTLLLRRVGSSMVAGRKTAENMLLNSINETDNMELDEDNSNSFKNFTEEELNSLNRFIDILKNHEEEDPKYDLLVKIIGDWLKRGCIVFSQYYDTIDWVAKKLTKDLPKEIIGLYAGGNKSGIFLDGVFERKTKDVIKKMVKERKIRLLLGTESASEGLNLQKLSSLVNLDLPWNPTRLEQRKGRIQRIGQEMDEIFIYNMRYKDSVEDKVHNMLSKRLENIYSMFGQIPDILEDAWIKVAFGEIENAHKIIDNVPDKHPFEVKYEEHIGNIDWESCKNVLDNNTKNEIFFESW